MILLMDLLPRQTHYRPTRPLKNAGTGRRSAFPFEIVRSSGRNVKFEGCNDIILFLTPKTLKNDGFGPKTMGQIWVITVITPKHEGVTTPKNEGCSFPIDLNIDIPHVLNVHKKNPMSSQVR